MGNVAKGLDPQKKQQQEIVFETFIEETYAPWFIAHRKSGKKTPPQIKRNFYPLLGKKPLNAIDKLIIDKWRTRRLNKGSKPATVNRDIAVLKSLLSKAIE